MPIFKARLNANVNVEVLWFIKKYMENKTLRRINEANSNFGRYRIDTRARAMDVSDVSSEPMTSYTPYYCRVFYSFYSYIG